MRGELMYQILNTLEDGVVDIVNVHRAIFSAGYGASLGRMEYEHRKIDRSREKYRQKRSESQESKVRLGRYISKLKNSGIIQQAGAKILLTKDGEKKLGILRKKLLKDIEQVASPNLIIFSYDIPVVERQKRDRIREILKMLKFEMIHQSLWVGKIKIPKELLKYLEQIKILKYVQILEVTKQGTLSKLT